MKTAAEATPGSQRIVDSQIGKGLTMVASVQLLGGMIPRLILFAFLALTTGAEARPNFLLILTDDHGWSQLSEKMDPEVEASFSDYLETPNINRLIHEGRRFTSGYSPAPLCTPTRRSILCGTSAARSGPEFKSDWVPAEHPTIPKVLKAANPDYRAAHFGKWGEQMISTPEECGYDASDGMTGNNTGGMPRSLGVKGGHEDGPPHFIDDEDPKLTFSVSDRAAAFMQEQHAAEHPFYIQVSYYAQHLSVVTSEAMLGKYEEKGTPDRAYPEAWAAMLEELDSGVGQLLDTLDELGISDETTVVFTTDNGGRGTVPGGDDSRMAPNFPLTGAKHSLWEGGVRVPFIARGPEVPAGSVCRSPVIGYDFLPTFLDLAGGDVSSLPDAVDGVSFRTLLHGGDEVLERDAGGLVFHRPNKLVSAFRQGDHKLRLNWKRSGEIDGYQLFNVAANVTEEGYEITLDYPEKATAMKTTLVDWLESIGAEKPQPLPQKRKKKKS